jgi:Ca-activated chloride channel family protein
VLEIKEHDVKVTINNGVAVTTVNQVFQNTEGPPGRGALHLPVPKGRSVSNFSMWIGGKEMVGEVIEKKRARGRSTRATSGSAAIPGCWSRWITARSRCACFPIAPRAGQRVQVTYYQELDYDHNRAVYVYPLATSTRPNVNARTSGKFALMLDVKSEIAITQLQSPESSADVRVAKHNDNYQQASLETRGGDLSRDVVLAVRDVAPAHRRGRHRFQTRRRRRLLHAHAHAGEGAGTRSPPGRWTTSSCSTSPAA